MATLIYLRLAGISMAAGAVLLPGLSFAGRMLRATA
jgi:hypothetical protein